MKEKEENWCVPSDLDKCPRFEGRNSTAIRRTNGQTMGLSFACTKGLRYLLWVEKKNLDRKIGHQGVRVGKFSLQAHKKPINL